MKRGPYHHARGRRDGLYEPGTEPEAYIRHDNQFMARPVGVDHAPAWAGLVGLDSRRCQGCGGQMPYEADEGRGWGGEYVCMHCGRRVAA